MWLLLDESDDNSTWNRKQELSFANTFSLKTLDLSKDKYYRLLIYMGSTPTFSNLQIKLKLQKGVIATSYSEYAKGTIDIEKTKKNLLKITDRENLTFQGASANIKNGVVKANGTTTSTGNVFFDIFKVPTDGDYTLSLRINGYTTKSSQNASMLLQATDDGISFSNVKELSFANSTLRHSTVSLSKNKYYRLRFYLYNECVFTDATIKVQLEKGTELTGFEEYKGNNYAIPLSQPLRSLPNGVKDTIEEDGIHRRVGSVILDGSENWSTQQDSYHTENRMLFATKIDTFGKGVSYRKGLCNYFKCYENTVQSASVDKTAFNFNNLPNYSDYIYFKIDRSALETEDLSGWKKWLSEHTPEVIYNLAEEVIEPFDEEQQAVMNKMETFEGVNHFSLVGDLETTLTFDYNPQITEEIKRAFKYNITKAYLEVAATDKASGFQINEDNYLQSIDFDDCRYIEGEGVIGSCVAKELQGKFVNVDTSFDIENREVECFIGAETEDNITHYLRLGTFIIQKPENDNVKDNTSFDSLDYMIKFNKEYVHRMAKYLKTEDTDIYPEKQYYILNESGVYAEVIVPHKEEISNYYELIDEYTLMQLLKDICEQCEVKLGTFNFRNADYLVHGNRFDSGVSCRDVLKAIAQAAFSWARINEYNELLLDFETSDTISEEIDYNEYYGLNFNDNYGPVNTIVLKNSQAEGENITIKNENLINSPAGKNLFNYDAVKIYTTQTQKISINNEKCYKSKNDTGNANVVIFRTDDLGLIENNTYTISFDIWADQDVDFSAYTFYINSKTKPQHNLTKLTTQKQKMVATITYIKEGSVTPWLHLYPKYIEENYIYISNVQIEKGPITTNYEDFIPLGPKELAISDNPFAYSEETRKAIIQAGEAIYGFKYVPLSVETIGAAYLNCKDKLKIKNMQDGDLETYVFDTRISYQGTLKSNVETLAMTDTETKYRYDGSLTTTQRRTEFRVDKAEQKITSLVKATTEQGEKLTEATQDLDGFKRTIIDKTDETNEKVTTIEEKVDGLITSKSVSGGQNLIKNSVGYFGNDYWQINETTEGKVLSENSTDVKQNSISGSALKLQAETIYQDIKEIKNGEYYLSFNYKKIISAAVGTLKINDLIINLIEQNWKEEAHLINVTTNNIKIEMTTDLNSSILITDLMLTEGNLQVSWTQNANESYTDTVQIGKGVRITATGSDTEFVAEATGITINNIETNAPVAEFTKYGTETQELVAHKDVKVADSLLIQKIGNQTWFSSL